LASKKNMGKVGAVLFAAGLPLGLFAGSAFAGDEITNHSTADAYVDQWTDVSTSQSADANTGDNHAKSHVWGENETEQDADASASEGNISAEDADDAIAGNAGGTNDQTSSSTNDGTSAATISTGPASATNTAATTVGQDNSGGASSTQGVTQTDIDGSELHNSSSANLSVTQGASVSTSQTAWANSGGNGAYSGVGGYNGTGQYANAAASGGNIDGYDAAGATAGNTGGSNTQGSTSANTGNSTASVTTGAATSSNSSTTSVTQTNSGGASSAQTVDQSDIDD
jgi:hypothetical protein